MKSKPKKIKSKSEKGLYALLPKVTFDPRSSMWRAEAHTDAKDVIVNMNEDEINEENLICMTRWQFIVFMTALALSGILTGFMIGYCLWGI